MTANRGTSKWRRPVLLGGLALAIMIAAVLAGAYLHWSRAIPPEQGRVAILIELGLQDPKPTSWSGKADIAGATLVHRGGYRFRPGDVLTEPNGWQASSYRPQVNSAAAPFLLLDHPAPVGIVLQLEDVQAGATMAIEVAGQEKAVVSIAEVLQGKPQLLWKGKARVRRLSVTSPISTGLRENDFPAAALGTDGTVWTAWIGYAVKDEKCRTRAIRLDSQPDNFQAYYRPEFDDQLFVRFRRGNAWSEAIAVTGPHEDLFHCALGVEATGTAWVIYSAHRGATFHICTRPILVKQQPEGTGKQEVMVGAEQQLTRHGGPHLNPAACRDSTGNLWVACQSWESGRRAVLSRFVCRQGQWHEAGHVQANNDANMWDPAIAAGPRQEISTAGASFKDGDYDIHLVVRREGEAQQPDVAIPVACSAKFEARPALAYDRQRRLWIAFEEGPEKWGKDWGQLASKSGNPLYNARAIRVACLDKDKLLQPAAPLPSLPDPPPGYPKQYYDFHTYAKQVRYTNPGIGIDGKGRIWLTYRQNAGGQRSSVPGCSWLTYARCLEGNRWSEPIEIHHSDGLLDHRSALLPDPSGGLLVIHASDGRLSTPDRIGNQIYVSTVNLPGEPQEPVLVPMESGRKDGQHARRELAAVQRIRSYRCVAGGKTYNLFRGDFHRHTEHSADGEADGSLEDMYRYAIDPAALDWVGSTDHFSGNGREYSWWLIQKFADAYHIPGQFTPMFTYERDVGYPHGHRNCMFARRGVRVLPRLGQHDPAQRVGNVHADDTKMLYRYLKELDGICASHTSATSMGTDWRDSDPALEPVVEIYQGDRMSYEYAGAPRAGTDPALEGKPTKGAWFPLGFVNLALRKGCRLGFQASSDHWSTHISYCVILAERNDRAAVMEALRQRHCYGATDNIILDVQSGSHLMGDEFATSQAPVLAITAIGLQPLARVDILKDSEIAHTFKPGQPEFHASWVDPHPLAGVHYYYVRVQQADGELAWGSPLWIDYQGK